jgi:hypothetical protein
LDREQADRFRSKGRRRSSTFNARRGYRGLSGNWSSARARPASGLNIVALEEATLGLESAGDQLTARLTAPVTDFANPQAVLPLAVEGRGQLTTWLARLRPFIGIPPLVSAEGQVELTAVGEIHLPEEITIAQSKLHAHPFRVAMPGFAIDEPSAELTLVGRYHPLRTDIAEATLNSVGTQAAPAPGGYGQTPELHGEPVYAATWRSCCAERLWPERSRCGSADGTATSKLSELGAVTAGASTQSSRT